MNVLLDTHVFLWWDQQDTALSVHARDTINRPENNIFISAATVWEIAIKCRTGKQVFEGVVIDAVHDNGFHELPILAADAEAAGDLEWQHADPFDRLLVAQAMRLGFILLTADRSIRAFANVAQIWAG